MNSMNFMKKTPMAAAAILLLAINTGEAAQVATYNAVTSRNNNFTMIDTNNLIMPGGSNKVSFTWDGTVYNANSDYTGPHGASNATVTSPDPFFGYTWLAHTVQIFGPGTFTFDTSLLNSVSNNEAGSLSMTVNPGQLGAHMLFDWNGNENIDVVVVWNIDSKYTGPMFIGTTQENPANNTLDTMFLLASMDGDSDGINGIPMPAGGPFQFSNANFSFKGPLAFTFSDQSGVALNTPIESQPVTIAGLASNTNNTADITISGGEYAISSDGGTTWGAWTNTTSPKDCNVVGRVCGVSGNSLNDKIKVKVRHPSAATNSTPTTTTLMIGLHSDDFTSTTAALVCDNNDTTPDNFPFTNQTDVALGVPIESAPITVSGICTGVNIAISVSGGEYAVSTDGGATYPGGYVSGGGLVTRDNRVKVRHTSSATGSTATSTTLTIGGVDGTFTSTTLAAAGIDSFPSTAAEPSGMSGSGCSISSTPVSTLERADWWLVACFMAWLGLIIRRRKALKN